jgi:CO/xanthine dehydrogenase FAD-binding subunit
VFTLRDIVQPETQAEAYELLTKQRSNAALGGCAFLRLGSKRIGTGIDLSKLNLDQITEQVGYIEIGAMTTFRDLETNPLLKEAFNGIIPKAVGNIIGVQFRNGVTVGGSVFSKYGFSDLLPALLALDTEVVLYKAGCIPLHEFLERPYEKDLLTHIRIRKEKRNASYQNVRISASDFPVLTVAVSCAEETWKIVVGARPRTAQLAQKASEQLSRMLSEVKVELKSEQKDDRLNSALSPILDQVVEELSFGSNARGSAEYRKAICKVLVERGITEVLACKSK